MRLIRENYLKMIRPFYETDLIKVITGVRRCGKSILIETIRDELLESGISGDHIIYINLEDLDYEHINTAADLNKEIKSRTANGGRYYIFIDEIQHVDGFEKALASFRATMDVSIFVTGSDSTLLSGELATLLTGRTVEFEVLPFSFQEMLSYYKMTNRECSDDLIYDYIKWGGFPLRFDFTGQEEIRKYLENLYDSIIRRDIKKKSSKFDQKLFKDISLYIMANAGKEFSVENVVNDYHTHNKRKVSSQTIYNYLEKMEKAYLIHRCEKYDISGKRALRSNSKFYAVDTGFRMINTNGIEFEDTFFLENVIYNNMLAEGFKVYTGKLYNGEIDFIAVKDGKKCFIQVAYLLASEKTVQREFGAFRPIKDASPKYVLSLDRVDMSRDGIVHLNIQDYLLGREKLMLS